MSDLYNVPVNQLPKEAPELPATEPVAVKMEESEGPYYIGFSIGLAEWGDFMNDLTDEEAGKLIRSLLAYCESGERETFEDRAIRLFYRQQCDAIDEQREKYQTAIAKMRR